jgi:hypothetical protein
MCNSPDSEFSIEGERKKTRKHAAPLCDGMSAKKIPTLLHGLEKTTSLIQMVGIPHPLGGIRDFRKQLAVRSQ